MKYFSIYLQPLLRFPFSTPPFKNLNDMQISALRAFIAVAQDIGLGAAGKGLCFSSELTGIHSGYAFAMKERKIIQKQKQVGVFLALSAPHQHRDTSGHSCNIAYSNFLPIQSTLLTIKHFKNISGVSAMGNQLLEP